MLLTFPAALCTGQSLYLRVCHDYITHDINLCVPCCHTQVMLNVRDRLKDAVNGKYGESTTPLGLMLQ